MNTNNRENIRLNTYTATLAILFIGAFLWHLGASLSGVGHGPQWAIFPLYVGAFLFLLGLVTFLLLIFWFVFNTVRNDRIHKGKRAALLLSVLAIFVIGLLLLRNPALDYAVFHGNSFLCRILLAAGANSLNEDLYVAARMGHLEIVKMLINGGAQVNARLGDDGDPVLAGAIGNINNRAEGNIEVIRYLLEHGADPSMRLSGDDDQTVKEFSAKTSRSPTVINLIEQYSQE